MTAFFLKPGFLFSVGGAALAAAGLNLNRVMSPVKPALVSGLKEGLLFKDWLAGKLEVSKEDLEDLLAEARFAYDEEVLLNEQTVKREKQLLDKIDDVIKKQPSTAKSAKGKKKTKSGGK